MMKLALVVIALLVLAGTATAADPWVDDVVSYSPGPSQWDDPILYPPPAPFHDSSLLVGEPHGVSAMVADNTSIATLGDGGRVTLIFNEPVKDDPDNPGGYDFIVFSNAIWAGGNPLYRWQELAYVEISNDGVNWYLIPGSKLPSQLIGATGSNRSVCDTGHSYSVVSGYAEYTPTLGLPSLVTRTAEEFYCIPDRPSIKGNPPSVPHQFVDIDAVSGGGDAFDIARAVRESTSGIPLLDSSNQMIPAGITEFKYVRITDAVTGDFDGVFKEVSAEIDAVADVLPAESIGKAKTRAEGEFSIIKDAVVTAVFGDEVYIQEEDRSAAMRLTPSYQLNVNVGDQIILTGHVSVVSGERIIQDPLCSVLSSGFDLRPLGMSNAAALGQIGRLVRTWGKVKENSGNYFTISDGSDVLKVYCPGQTQPTYDQPVVVTGVIGPLQGETVLKVRTQADILPLQ